MTLAILLLASLASLASALAVVAWVRYRSVRDTAYGQGVEDALCETLAAFERHLDVTRVPANWVDIEYAVLERLRIVGGQRRD